MLRCARALGRLAAELAPLAALTAVVLYAVGSYTTDQFQGGGDALWYYTLMADAVQQARAGVFPVSVGQTNASWNGYPTALLPGFLYTGLAIDVVTGRRLSAVQVQQLVGVWGLWAGAVSAYYCLRSLLPARRWLAAALACVYVCSPALMALLTAGDMYPGLSTAPYFPLLLHGLIRGARRGDAVGVAFVGAALALLWMCHAGIALWCSTGTALFLAGHAVLSGHFWRTSRFSLFAAALFLVLSSWYFGTVFSLGIHRAHTFNQYQPGGPTVFTGAAFGDALAGIVERAAPKWYRPLPTVFDDYAAQQFGYTVLALLGFAAVAATRVRSLELRLLVAGGLVLLMAVLPIPRYTWFFWAHLPRPFLVTENCPTARFGVILGGITVFAVALVVERLSGGGGASLCLRRTAPGGAARRYALPARWVCAAGAVAVAVGVAYSLSEIGTIRAWVIPGRPAGQAGPLVRPENQPLSVFNWLTFKDPRTDGVRNVKDLYLYDRVLAKDGSVLASNGDTAERGAPAPFAAERSVTAAPDDGPRPLVRFRVEPGRHYLLTVRADPRNADYWFRVAGGTLGHVHRPPFNGMRPQAVVIPVWTTAAEPQDVCVSVACARGYDPGPTAVRAEVVSLVAFDQEALPVRVRSLMPYTATLRADRPADLETHRQFVPGYEAWVNGARVEPARAANGMLQVPLVAGENEVKLVYRGPPLSRAALVVSAVAWLGLFGFAARRAVVGCRPLPPASTDPEAPSNSL